MSSWFEERRADKAADAAERRRDEEHSATLRRNEHRKDREERRQEKAQQRRDRVGRRQARVARREKALKPSNVYRKGTLALVLASAAASLPAQIMHFAGISLMLLPIPFALEGAAWVMNAGVAYADERKLAGWVRWLMRGFAVSAAGYAAHINLDYGLSLAAGELTQAQAAAVGWGLAAVTMLGPLFFEVRQWVLTLSAATTDQRKEAEARSRAKHEKRRRKHHKDVVKLAQKLVSAAPYGQLAFEDAFASAWEVLYGTRTPGMTPTLHAQAHVARQSLAEAFTAADGSPESIRGRLMEVLHPAPVNRFLGVKKPQAVTDLPPASKTPSGEPKKSVRRQPPLHRRRKGDALPFHPFAKTQAADTARKHVAVNGHHH